jgi:hypothetical protein
MSAPLAGLILLTILWVLAYAATLRYSTRCGAAAAAHATNREDHPA